MKRIAIAALLGVAALLAGCDSSPKAPAFQLTDITGAQFARDFQLIDHNGKPRTLADFKGKVVAIFFGYTRCPDACPTTMGELALVMKELGTDAERLQVLFITVDPERDTPEVLSRYVPAFHPSFLGLYGDAEATARTAKEFRIIYQKQPLKDSGYSVDHSAGSYLYDTNGRVRLFAQYGQGAQPLLHDIRLLLQTR
jgi:protein SCO1/2